VTYTAVLNPVLIGKERFVSKNNRVGKNVYKNVQKVYGKTKQVVTINLNISLCAGDVTNMVTTPLING